MSRVPNTLRSAAPWSQTAILVRAGLHDATVFFRQALFGFSLLAGVFLTALAGPFGTYVELSFVDRLVYWSLAILVPTVVASTLSLVLCRITRAYRRHWLLAALPAGLLTVPPALAAVVAAERLLVHEGPSHSLMDLLPMVGWPVIIVTLLINAALVRFTLLRDALTPTTAIPVPLAEGPATPKVPHLTLVARGPDMDAQPLLFQRIPGELGRDLVCLRAQDHYLEVTTTRGSALVLMRLRDAERDLAAIKGMRVHRSWWVALDHVACFSRAEGGGVTLLTSTGQQVPVARGQRDALRDALSRHRDAAE